MMSRVPYWLIVVLWLVVPALFYGLSQLDTDRGLIWFVLHQLYYAPLGLWLPEPFFTPDSEVYFWVRPLGRALAAAFYVALFIGGRSLVRNVRRNPM